MKRLILSSAVALTALSAAAHGMPAPAMADPAIIVPDSTGFTFTDILINKTTPVKDQNKSGTCWSFSGTSILEDEVMRNVHRQKLLYRQGKEIYPHRR